MRIKIESQEERTREIEIEAKQTNAGWQATVFEVDEDTGKKIALAIGEGESANSAKHYAAAWFFADQALILATQPSSPPTHTTGEKHV